MIFLGCMYEKQDKEQILNNSKCGVLNAGNVFQSLIIDGFIKNGVKDLDIVSVLPVGCWPKYYKKMVLKDKKNHYPNCRSSYEVGSINLPFIKQLQRSIKIRKHIKKFKTPQDVVIYSPAPFFLKAFKKSKVKHNVTLIVTDLPEYYDLTAKKQGFLRKKYTKMMYNNLKYVDKFIILTEQMKEPLKIGNKPYLVMEGICTNEIQPVVTKNLDTKTIMYSGTLNYKFGIKNLLDAFELIKNENYRLLICGSGEAEQEIKERAKLDNRIDFKGYVDRDLIVKWQQEATLLVNPRPNAEEYVKYSFPSKTMEYLASGTPLVMYKLPGIPNDYDKYINYVEGDTVENLKNKIVEICEKSSEELQKMGIDGQHFVCTNKNNLVQSKRILDFINK